MKRFANRKAAGRLLGEELKSKISKENLIVLGLARGGVPVASEVAQSLKAPLDLLVVRKLGLPWHPELAFGAIAPDNIAEFNHSVVTAYSLSDELISDVEAQQRAELERRLLLYRRGLDPLEVHNKTVILVDDGLATGATMRAALSWASQHNAAKIIVAVPVASKEAHAELLSNEKCAACACLLVPRSFSGVGEWYEDFSQVSDEQVIEIMKSSAHSNSQSKK